ncbi:MAG: 30S ribosomal protein S20 [Bacilli bacterium]|nr:30S ribosomal protein S20 [Bacilli bacterium]
MANIKSQIKRAALNDAAHAKNQAAKSEIKVAEKKVLALVAEGKKEEAAEALKAAFALLDAAAGKVYAKNTVARRKSILSRAVNSVK